MTSSGPSIISVINRHQRPLAYKGDHIIDSASAGSIYGTAWLALGCWAATQWLPPGRWSRITWTAGCLANLGHVLLAMQIMYGWDQGLAYAGVAEQTFLQTGFDSGVGLYINYAFAALWLVDTVAWWLWPRSYENRPRWLDGVLQFVFLFMFFNATVVFGKTMIRYAGAIICPVAVIGWCQNRLAKDRLKM